MGACSLSSEDGTASYTSDSDILNSGVGGFSENRLQPSCEEGAFSVIQHGAGELELDFEGKLDVIHNNKAPKSENGFLTKRLWDITTTKLRISTNAELNEKPEYCTIAEQYVEEAEIKESTKNYRAAFDLYKKAISCWLSGVQSDMNQSRRNMIKEKTSTYLLRAEYIANNFLTDDIPETAESEPLPFSQLWRPVSQLRNYKVLSVVNKVMLVMEISTHSLYIIKPLRKSLSPFGRKKKCILPRGGPYMVDLYSVFETDNSVYLLLQHISTGKLWDYVTPYFIKESDFCGCESRLPVNNSSGNYDVSSSHSFSEASFQVSLAQSSTDLSVTLNSSQSSLSSHGEICADHGNDSSLNDVAACKSEISQPISEHEASFSLSNSEQNETKEIGIFACPNPLMKIEHVTDESLDIHESERNEVQKNKIDEKDPTKCFDKPQSTNKNCDIDTNVLVEKAQALLKSVDEILNKSEIPVSEIQDFGANLSYDHNVDNFGTIAEYNNEKKGLYKSKLYENFNEERDSQSNVKGCNNAVDIRETISAEENCRNNNFSFDPSRLHPDLTRGVSPVSSGSEADVQWTGWGSEGKGLNSELVVKWASQLVVAINYLHVFGIIFRDLNPDNILVNNDGNICLTYQCQFPGIEPLLDYKGLKSIYIAPECFNVREVSHAADWWSFGVLIYNLITGQSLSYYHSTGIYEHSIIYIPDYISSEAKSLLENLLKYDSSQRLGSGSSGIEEIKTHPFFKGVNWEKVYKDGLSR